MGLFGFFKRKVEFEQAKEAREAFLAQAEVSGVDAEFNRASGLMLEEKFQETIAAYQELAERHPDRRGDCEAQIGAAQFFLGEYDEAIASYVRAREHGADSDMMDDNLWEACEQAAERSGRRNDYARRYLELCPQGIYVKRAQKLLTA